MPTLRLRARSWFAGILILGFLSAGVGCGDGKAHVRGTVSFDGKSVDRGVISFDPADGRGPNPGAGIPGGRCGVGPPVPYSSIPPSHPAGCRRAARPPFEFCISARPRQRCFFPAHADAVIEVPAESFPPLAPPEPRRRPDAYRRATGVA